MFFPDGTMTIDYSLLPDDVRDNGLVQGHSIMVPPTPEFVDSTDAIKDALVAYLERLLDEHQQATAVMPEGVEIEDDDEEPGPWDNPTER